LLSLGILKRRHEKFQKTAFQTIPVPARATGNDSGQDVTLLFMKRNCDQIVLLTIWADPVSFNYFSPH
jgi:hypothetical protein